MRVFLALRLADFASRRREWRAKAVVEDCQQPLSLRRAGLTDTHRTNSNAPSPFLNPISLRNTSLIHTCPAGTFALSTTLTSAKTCSFPLPPALAAPREAASPLAAPPDGPAESLEGGASIVAEPLPVGRAW